MNADPIFEPIRFSNLEVKNRIFRSSIAGRFDNYDGSGAPARINWEEKFARGGVGAIITSFVPVTVRGRIVPNYATIDCDERIRFWREVVERVHKHDSCKFIIQLSHSGRQRDNEGVENWYPRVVRETKVLSPTNRREPVHGFPCKAMTLGEVEETVELFADGARRAQEAGADGIETHSANGYLFTQFLSSAINDRTDKYGGVLVNRARFLLDVVRAIRRKIGNDFHFQVKISAIDRNNAVLPWEKPGNTLDDSVQVCKWVERPIEWARAAGEDLAQWENIRGADAIHVSSGSMFPHPLNPPGELPLDVLKRTYETVISTGELTFRNFVLFQFGIGRWLFAALWNRIKKHCRGFPLGADRVSTTIPPGDMQHRLDAYQGVSLGEAKRIKEAVGIPVLCTGGFQQASYIRRAITEKYCDAVAIARPLIANNDLVKFFEQGYDLPPRPCTYCNRCLLHDVEDPLGCYEIARYGGDYEAMIREVMSVFRPG
jgi:2,4-dienoyl-CoA reductase-like NADH-dependent reductase (Old Yellow Enzyme family)